MKFEHILQFPFSGTIHLVNGSGDKAIEGMLNVNSQTGRAYGHFAIEGPTTNPNVKTTIEIEETGNYRLENGVLTQLHGQVCRERDRHPRPHAVNLGGMPMTANIIINDSHHEEGFLAAMICADDFKVFADIKIGKGKLPQ